MDDLTAFVTARLDEDEAYAREPDGWNEYNAGDPADPQRILREVAAKRMLIEEVTLRSTRDVAEIYVATLATVWSDHPDYRPEWDPSAL